ncbi:MAG: hypothetical protein LBH18_05475 [Spirochaetaceae bacterium]|nr:hypothetical protein [Spirochaetaceae bacterium]
MKKKLDGTISIQWKDKLLKITELPPNKDIKQPISASRACCIQHRSIFSLTPKSKAISLTGFSFFPQ